jgi:hypothetical protein
MTEPRLQWRPDGATGDVAAVWFLKDQDVAAELAEVLPALEAGLGHRVTRLSLSIDGWPTGGGRRVALGSRLVRLGWFQGTDPVHSLPLHVMSVRMGDDRSQVFVVPGGPGQEQVHEAFAHDFPASPKAAEAVLTPQG